jgi:hypothetical protein
MARWNVHVPEIVEIVDTSTGEMVAADEIVDTGDVEWIAGALAALDSHDVAIKQIRGRLDAALEAARVRGVVASSDVIAGVKLPRKLTRRWNADRTVAALALLVDNGVITEGRADRLAPTKPAVKPDGKALVALLGELDGKARETLRGACSETVRWEAVEVSR